MGLFSFISTAGEKLFGGSQIDENAVREHILSLGLQLSALSVVAFQAEKKVALIGRAATMQAKEKAMLAAGNVKGVEQVEDRLKRVPVADASASMTAASPAVVAQADTDEVAESVSAGLPTANFYPVKAGDTLSAIAKRETPAKCRAFRRFSHFLAAPELKLGAAWVNLTRRA